MPNWNAIKASFLHLTQPQQLGELASSLAHLKSWIQSSDFNQVIPVPKLRSPIPTTANFS
ncbi:hypothetical protein H6G80_03495 [Nostoc sp. FACHB-87]|uniref:hypothetical protein n=1 Tax=Nostocaceae TaxID=1162 RepID=UPI001683251F|nr:MULTISPECIES: hypothetical protein [Nostocaceae]MBD2453139.1 hypothetical protein [Nostoc sp. FACHB-87]MBD2475082.1 hypothetical protein [Anabaena sp. FACHB-83]